MRACNLVSVLLNSNMLSNKCIITNLELNKNKKYGRFYSRVIHNLYKKYNCDIEKTKTNLNELIYVSEVGNYYTSWAGCSKGLGKSGNVTLDRQFLYEKYFKNISKCRVDKCNNEVPFEMVRLNACCTLHYNQDTSVNYDKSKAKFICLENGNSFMSLNHLTRHIKSLNLNTEDYYNKYHRIDEKEGKCLWCLSPVKFKNVEVGYGRFCHNTNCNINWHNKHTNRAANCANKISNTLSERGRLPSHMEYWMNRGYTSEYAQILVQERQATNTVEKIMNRRGCSQETATDIRAEITNKWLASFPRLNYSKVSQQLFWEVYNRIKNDYSEIYFASFKSGKLIDDGTNHEYGVKTNRSTRKLDFFIKDINKCIEFDGAYWHGKVGKGDKTRDIIREQEIVDAIGCQIFHVKEMDYYKDKELVVQNCINFLNNDDGQDCRN